MARNSFSIHADFYDELAQLDHERCGQLIKALALWAQDSPVQSLDSECALLFRLITAQIERLSSIRSDAGSRGGAPKGNVNAKKEQRFKQIKQNKPSITKTKAKTETKSNTIEESARARPSLDEIAAYCKSRGNLSCSL